MADLIHGNTQMGATKMDIITALVQRELKFAAKLANYFTDVSRFAVKGAKSISFPKLGSFTVTERASGTAGDASVITSTSDQLLLNIPAYIAYIVDSNDAQQSVIEWEAECAKRAGAAHARYLDSKLITELVAAAGFVNTTGADVDISKTSILNMREFIRSNEGDLDQSVLLVGTDGEKTMLGIDEFTRADIYGSSNVPAGMIGRVYGMPVLMHNAMPAKQAIVATKDSLAFGFQLGPNASEQGANQYGSAAKRVAVDQLFGVKALQIDQYSKTAPIAGKSGLIAKLND